MKKIKKSSRTVYMGKRQKLRLLLFFIAAFSVSDGGNGFREAVEAAENAAEESTESILDEKFAVDMGADLYRDITDPGWNEETESQTEEGEEWISDGIADGAAPEGETGDGSIADTAGTEDGGTGVEDETEENTDTDSEEDSGGQELTVSLPENFCIPMAMPEQEEVRLLPVRTLEDSRRLRSLQSRLSGEQEARLEETYRSSLSLLRTMLENRIAGYDGEWSVYVKNLNTNKSFVINDEPMKSASVMKLFIMGTVYKAFESGELERTDETVALLSSMITVSSNDASNQLLYLLGDSNYEAGIQKVNEFIAEYGFSELTIEYNGFSNAATVISEDNNNQVTAADCGKLLEDIYRRTWMNRETSNEIEKMLLNQQTRYKIPAGLPDGVLCGNKSGEMSGTENDAAIIFGEKCDYILVVLSSDWSSSSTAISRISSISALVYEFLNK